MDTNETKVYIVISIAAILFTIIIVFFIVTIIQHQRKMALLYKKQIEAEINTLETERKRVASDLHDDLGPLLSAIKLNINCLNSTNEEDNKIIDKTSKYIDDVFNKVRETSNNLMPWILIRKGLILALKEFAYNINEAKSIIINTDFSQTDIRFSPHQEIHLYRVIQEIVNNTIKHSEAKKVTIHFNVANKFLVLKISDDGKGFNSDKLLKEATGFGLKNILSRVDILNGEMYLDTAPGKGVVYTINVPIIP